MFASVAAGRYQYGGTSWAGSGTKRANGIAASKPVLESARPALQTAMTADTMKTFLPRLSSDAAAVVARKLGVNKLSGKFLDYSKIAGLDNPVSVIGDVNENEPSMAVNPINEQIAVIFNHSYVGSSPSPCIAEVSYDGGDTWDYNNYVTLPLLGIGDSCSDPVVRYAPDGSYVYYIYMDIASSGTTSKIVLVRGDPNDPTVLVSGPTVVLDDGGTDFMDKPWGDVATYAMSNGGSGQEAALYVTSTKFYGNGDCGIVMNVSLDYGATWYYSTTNPLLLEPYGYPKTGCTLTVQGARAIGGPNNFMIVCFWDDNFAFQSGNFYFDCIADDGNGTGTGPAGWSAWFSPGLARNYEMPYWLPGGSSVGDMQRWWTSMFPVLAVDPEGMVYLAFGQDPTVSKVDIEAGNVYTTKRWLDYNITLSWPAPAAIGSGSTAQGFPTLAAGYDPLTKKYTVYLAYGDYTAKNGGYYTVYRKGVRPPKPLSGLTLTVPGTTFGAKIRASDVWSLSDATGFIGDYIDSALTSRRYHLVWTDRADAMNLYNGDDDILHDVFVP